jgi:hypothetical protein
MKINQDFLWNCVIFHHIKKISSITSYSSFPFSPQQCTLDAACHCQDAWNNTYSCVRHLSTNTNFIYCEFQDEYQFVESYNLAVDQWELKNIAFDMLPSVHAKYSLALAHLKDCTGDSCRQIY